MRTIDRFDPTWGIPSCTRSVLFAMVIPVSLLCASGNAQVEAISVETSPEKAIQWFSQRDKTVVTFMGYSGAGYEDPEAMLAVASKQLAAYEPDKTIVNIGATSSGIGAVYEVAKKLGFTTTGIVSTEAKKYEADLSPSVQRVFYIPDETWGGLLEGTNKLAPTSRAMVRCSDVVVCIGGGAVSRDEMLAAKKLGKDVKYFPADMDHQKAIDKAQKKGLPAPTDFKGAAHVVSGKPAPPQ